nr:helix-turn-helix domain-containing protein [Ligilactobacillus saerimneri]
MMIDDVAWVESLSPKALKRLAERMGEVVPTSTQQTKTERQERLLQVGQAAEFLGMSTTTFYRKREKYHRIFKPLECGEQGTKFRQSDLERLIEEHPEVL